MPVPGVVGGQVSVRVRLGERRVLVVPSNVPVPAEPERSPEAPPPAELPQRRYARVVLAVVEAVPSRADALAVTVLKALEKQGRRCTAVSLEPQNRLEGRAPRVFSAPSLDDGPDPTAISAMLSQASESADFVVVDLGCRWSPKQFRPVLTQATQIWVVARAGQWTGVEMRLEQAELSGWTPMHRVRLVVIGEEPAVPPGLTPILAGVLRDPEGPGAVELIMRELGRMGG